MAENYVYKKITIEDINLPQYCHFFIKEIQDSVEEYDVKNPGDELEVTIESYIHPYCYDALSLVVKAFERKNFTISVPTYKLEKDEDGDKKYIFTWKLTKRRRIDDLPF